MTKYGDIVPFEMVSRYTIALKIGLHQILKLFECSEFQKSKEWNLKLCFSMI